MFNSNHVLVHYLNKKGTVLTMEEAERIATEWNARPQTENVRVFHEENTKEVFTVKAWALRDKVDGIAAQHLRLADYAILEDYSEKAYKFIFDCDGYKKSFFIPKSAVEFIKKEIA